jgi:hypothetical protein
MTQLRSIPGQLLTHGHRRRLLALAFALLTVTAAVSSSCGSSTSVEDVETLIEENLPLGSTAQEIFAFLDSRDIGHGAVERAGAYTTLAEAGVPSDTKVIGALIRGTSRGLFTRTDIEIFFILDDHERLEDYIVGEVYTGL